tara:strand:- start:234 stop:494 length:261 start_codon:yes stop_codon:yes gene_type:complete
MYKNIKNIFFLLSFAIFLFLTINHYLSNENVIFINKSRLAYTLKTNENLPLLKNDTNNIIIYTNELDQFKKKRKKRFWERLINNNE